MNAIRDKKNLITIPPLSYLEYGKLIESAKYVVTDSAGTQEETTIAGTPCFTIGKGTARPETILEGTNKIIGYDLNKISFINKRKKYDQKAGIIKSAFELHIPLKGYLINNVNEVTTT
jgi:UDP-N-acetylglucosamine 2-epimerase